MSDLDYGGGSAPPAQQQPIPSEGIHDAICYATVDWGYVLDEFDGVVKGVCPAVRWFFELDEKMADGRPFVLSTYPVKIKYGEKSKFVGILKGWLPAKEHPAKWPGYPLGATKGRMASLNVEHRAKDDGTFSARIEKIMKGRPGATPLMIVNTALPPWVADAKRTDNEKAAKYQENHDPSAAHDDPRPADTESFDSVPF